jgi:hypothetical protein
VQPVIGCWGRSASCLVPIGIFVGQPVFMLGQCVKQPVFMLWRNECILICADMAQPVFMVLGRNSFFVVPV